MYLASRLQWVLLKRDLGDDGVSSALADKGGSLNAR